MDPKETEKRFYALGVKIANYDSLVVLVKKISDEIEGLKKTNDVNRKFQDESEKSVKSFQVKTESNFKDAKSKLDDQIVLVQSLCIDSVRSKDAQESLSIKLDDMHLTFSKEIAKFKESVDSSILCFHQKNSGFEDAISEIKAKLKNVFDVLENRNQAFSTRVSASEQSSKDAYQKQKVELTDLISSKLASLEKKLDGSRSEFTDAVKELGKKSTAEISRVQQSIPVVKEKTLDSKISEKLELLSLDTNNANLKASNLETQVKFLDKKIENILLLLKQNELKK